MEEKDSFLEMLYDKKYLNKGIYAKNHLVAPRVSGERLLSILGFKKEGEKYPYFEDKTVTDIGSGFSSLAFELSPSVKEITLVDPIFAYDQKAQIQQEIKNFEDRARLFDNLSNIPEKSVIKRQELQGKVREGMKKWENFDFTAENNIKFNSSFAQKIADIPEDSQDIVFLNFLLNNLQGAGTKEDEIIKAIDNAYKITKSGGRIIAVHDIEKETVIMNALGRTPYINDASDDKEGHLIFFIDKKETVGR